MIIVDALLLKGIRFVLDKVAKAVDAEMNDVDRLREELLVARMQVETGEMSEPDYEELEREIVARLGELQKTRGIPEGATVKGAEVTVEVD